MSDSVSARLSDARTLLSRAAYELEAGECRERAYTAMAAIEDAVEQREDDLRKAKLQRHLEVFADAAAAPGVNCK